MKAKCFSFLALMIISCWYAGAAAVKWHEMKTKANEREKCLTHIVDASRAFKLHEHACIVRVA